MPKIVVYKRVKKKEEADRKTLEKWLSIFCSRSGRKDLNNARHTLHQLNVLIHCQDFFGLLCGSFVKIIC